MSKTGELAMHETILIRRVINASPGTIFAAWASPDARVQWGPPSSDDAMEYLTTDFRVGGTDVSLCGPKGDLKFRVEAHYLDIQDPHRLLFSERVLLDGSLLSVSLVTVELDGSDGSTELVLTIQIASLVGKEMITGSRHGWTAAIGNLCHHIPRK